MHSDLLEDQAEARLIQLRQQRLRKPSKAEKRDSRSTSASATGYVTDAIVPMPGMSFLTDAARTAVVPMPGMSFLTAQTAANVYAPKQLSMGPAEALPALAPPFPGNPSQASAPAGEASVLAVVALPGERAEVR